jgi:putative FmdB family regulatory protein
VRHKSHTQSNTYYKINAGVEEGKMPTYEYECEKCGNKFENFHWFGGAAKKLKCPKCGAENPKIIISPIAKNSPDKYCDTRSFG